MSVHPNPVPRPRDTVWDTMETLFGHVVSGTQAHKKRNKAVKDLKLMDATPDSLQRAYRSFQSRFTGCTCTDIALATHYPMLSKQSAGSALSEFERHAAAARAGQLGSPTTWH